MIDKKQAAFERKLGAKLDPFIESLNLELKAVGREIGGKKGCGATKKIVLDIVTKLCAAQFAANVAAGDTTQAESNDVPINMFTQRSAIECFVELLQAEGFDFSTALEPIVPEAAKEEAVGSDNEEGESDDEEELNTAPASSKASAAKKGAAWDWHRDLMAILKNKAGLVKLNNERPSTAAVGNWGILEVTQRLSELYNLGSYVSARLFMGKKKTIKSKIDVPLSKKDTEQVIRGQWDTLRNVLTHQDEVLLFHVKNHYALIFAAREYTDLNTGQRPTAWLDFEEVRQVMLGWDGYKIMCISSSVPIDVLRNNLLTPAVNTDGDHL
eukprot:gene23786-26919_t